MVFGNMNEEMKEQFTERVFQDLLIQLEAKGLPAEKLDELKEKGAKKVLAELEESGGITISTLPVK